MHGAINRLSEHFIITIAYIIHRHWFNMPVKKVRTGTFVTSQKPRHQASLSNLINFNHHFLYSFSMDE